MNGALRYRRAADVRYRVLDGEAIVVRQRAAEVLGLDAIGSRLLDLFDGERTLAEVVERLAAEYRGERATIEADVAAFVSELVEAGVVEPVEPPR
jgi:hypothetical protein